MLPRLPTEMCERVIDFTAENYRDTLHVITSEARSRRQTLLACLSTCRAWVPRSRLHLYAVMTLYSKKETRGLLDLITTCPHIKDFIHVVQVYYPRGANDNMVVMLSIAPMLTKLKELVISWSAWAVAHPSLFMAMGQFRSVTKLDMGTMVFGTPRELAKFIFPLRSLSILKYGSIYYRETLPYTLPRSLRRPLPLTSIYNLGMDSSWNLLRDFHLTLSGAHMKSFHAAFTDVVVDAVPVIGQFLSSCELLETIDISLESLGEIRLAAISSFEFQNLCSLKSFAIQIPLCPKHLEIVLKILSTIKSAPEKISITIRSRHTDKDVLQQADNLEWRRMDTSLEDLAEGKKLGFVNVTFAFWATSLDSSQRELLVESVHRKLSQIDKRGILACRSL